MVAQLDSIIDIVRKYVAELERHSIPVRQAILYGSFAHGQIREESDIDVALVSESFTGDRFEDRRRIVPLRRKIDNRIEPMPFTPTRFSDGGNLIDEIKKTGIRID
ncbi:MAG: nucleotidyltransferase domain-containing protein [Deltaproteobacteria bacterium]|nr:nucleotidyltransferase domain-containing protein [Deltaproteobacteria bacterium]